MILHRCRAKYLGKSGATAPKIGTLENTARIYQKGCLNINDREPLSVTVTSKAISIENDDGLSCFFPIKSTLFCATFKKIPQVVAFNYLSAKEPPSIECHALYMDSGTEAQAFVEAITTAFNNAYRATCFETESIGSDAESRESSTTICSETSQNKKNPWLDKISDIFGVFSSKKVR